RSARAEVLPSAHLAARGALLGGALGGLRVDGGGRLLLGAFRLLAAAPALGGGAQPPAHAGRLRPGGLALAVGGGLRAHVVLAADQLDLGDLGRIAAAEPEPQ